ncbi:hypothetical protein FB567DRAFT_87241 [Paraphoma chrysanthemicola]|uniref:GPI anchored protein n=1 Tax=Paraphoma chrysanthemicola TaxID=798071 RepID=A0A8K0R219_9PLEO|nr:hypothetical protein FB567DRAFT_87241 [Paraphoma chrysanthemicola]
MVRAVFVVLGMLGAALAQSSEYTGPMFDPGNAPFFGPSSLVIPTLSNAVPTTEITPTFIRSRISSAASGVISSSGPLVTGSASRNATISASATLSASNSSSVRLSSSTSLSSSLASSSLATSASRTSSAASSASAPAQSTGAAVANAPAAVGAIMGGVLAGLAML